MRVEGGGWTGKKYRRGLRGEILFNLGGTQDEWTRWPKKDSELSTTTVNCDWFVYVCVCVCVQCASNE